MTGVQKKRGLGKANGEARVWPHRLELEYACTDRSYIALAALETKLVEGAASILDRVIPSRIRLTVLVDDEGRVKIEDPKLISGD